MAILNRVLDAIEQYIGLRRPRYMLAHLPSPGAKPPSVSVSRCAHVFLDPVVAAADWINAVTHLRDHAIGADLAGMLEHLAPLDLEALVNWTAVAVVAFFSSDFRRRSGTFRKSRPFAALQKDETSWLG